MSLVLNPYKDQHQVQLGLLENGLKSLKLDKNLMSDAEFSDMYWAAEKHHRDLRLAHLTGKAKDLMIQAEKDTKFYNILMKMLGEVKCLPRNKKKESLKKVHLWYMGNKHTLATGPRFGKTTQRLEGRDMMMSESATGLSKTPTSGRKQLTSRSSHALTGRQSNKDNKAKSKSEDSQKQTSDAHESTSTPQHGYRDNSIYPPSEPASSRLSLLGNDFMTSRFMSDLPMSKLGWNQESPMGKSPYDLAQTPTDWEGTDIELQRIAESSLSRPTFDGHYPFQPSHPSVPNSSPQSNLGDSPRSVGSGDSDGNHSSKADVGSTDMMDFHSEVRRRISRGQTSTGGSGNDVGSHDQSSSGVYGLQKKMVHSIASLVNPHAKLAESEAKKQEQDYRELYSARSNRSASRNTASRATTIPDLSAHIPVLRAVSVNNNRPNSVGVFNSFRHDHMYGQDILSVPKSKFRTTPYVKMPPLSKGKLNFVGRSGTALDVRYAAHAQGDMPENHTREIIQLYSTNFDEATPGMRRSLRSARLRHLVVSSTSMSIRPSTSMSIRPASQSETIIHNQSLEDFYQTAEQYYPTNLPKYRSSRIQSAPGPRVKSGSKSARGGPSGTPSGAKTAQPRDRRPSIPKQQKLGKNYLTNGDHQTHEGKEKDDIGRPKSAVNLDAVVGMIDQVKDEMNFFREKLAPTPMPGFRQPASTGVSNKPLSRPTSTASRKSQIRSGARSPSPQGRPGTPTDDLMMGLPDVPADTYRSSSFPNRPHSASVNKAVDWRGKVTPEATKIRSKSRFGGHTYVQKLKPSLRTAGATTAGNRPKTAPVSVQERWGTREREGKKSSKLPDFKVKNFPSIAPNYPYYPVKQEEKPSPIIITITECDKNTRVLKQAAGNNMTQIDDGDMDRIMQIQHLMGTSDSKYGSMGSLFLDEDFLRSLNARYHAGSSMSQLGPNSQREFLSIVGPTPRVSPAIERSPSRQTARKPDIQQIPEESASKDEDTSSVDADTGDDQQAEEHNKENEEPVQGLDGTAEETVAPPGPDTKLGDHPTATTPLEEFETARDAIEVTKEDYEGGIHIEVTAIPATGRSRTPPPGLGESLQELSKSEAWHYQPDVEQQEVDSNNYLAEDQTKLEQGDGVRAVKIRRPYSADYASQYHHHTHEHSWTKSIVKPENYCFQCLPDNMTTKVGRSAGRMPGGAQSPAGQVLRMAKRQNEHYKKTPPVRTPPSIPSPHHPLGGRSPRQGQQYSTELEHHARKTKSPRHFMEQVVELRNDNCKSAPAGSRPDGSRPDGSHHEVLGSLSVISLHVPGRAQTAPTSHSYHSLTDHVSMLPSHPEEESEEAPPRQEEPESGLASGQSKSTPITVPSTSQSLTARGRPIPQVTHIPDPDQESQAVLQQKQAKAAVDIQRIFRGYVCRESYRMLLWDNRKDAEDKQQAQTESHSQLKKHRGRLGKINNRPPLDPELLQWAKDYKEIRTENQAKREEKVDTVAQEMLVNQVKAKSKIEVIGPHVEIYDIYHPKGIGPSKRDMHRAAVKMQQHVRGFLIRRRFEKLRRKATFCGSTWEKMVKDYKSLLIRVQRWHGRERPATPFAVQEMYEYMDMRRRYESQFDKKSFGGELELVDLEPFFRECDLYPSKLELEEGLDVINQGRSVKKGLQKHEVLNLLYYIYVPPATGLAGTRQSTWMNPIINGVEAKKLIDGDPSLEVHPIAGNEFVEAAPLKPCANLVIQSRKERREKEEAEREMVRRATVRPTDADSEEEDEALKVRREKLLKFVHAKDDKPKK